jgi:hypothetical protein
MTCTLVPERKIARMRLMSLTTLGQLTSGKKPSKERRRIFLDRPQVVVLGFFASGGA